MKISFVSILCMVIPMTETLFYFVSSSSRSLNSETGNSMMSAAAEKSSQIDGVFNDFTKIASGVAQNPGTIAYFKELKNGNNVSPAQKKVMSDYLASLFKEANGNYENIFFAYDGEVVVDGIGGKSEGYVFNRKLELWYDIIMKNATWFVGSPIPSPITGRPVVVVGVSIIDPYSKEVLGGFVTPIDMINASKTSVKSKAANPMKTFVIDSSGLVVSSEDETQILKLNLNKEQDDILQFYNDLKDKKTGIGYFTFDGVQNIAAFSKLESKDMYVISYEPVSQFKSKVDELRKGIVWLNVGSIILFTAILLFLLYRIIRPIHFTALEAQNEVLSLLACGKPQSDILHKIAEQTNSKLIGRFCSIMLIDKESRIFRNGASPLFPSSYIEAIENSPIDHKEMYVGRAILSKQPVLIEDITRDPLWEHSRFKSIFESHGTKAFWIFPVLSLDNNVIATYSLFSAKSGRPKAYELGMIKAFIHLISIAIERKESESKIHRLAFYDTLTGLYNRSQFLDQFQVSLKEAEQGNRNLALLFIDLDQFKWVNDTLGHDVGDQLLTEIADRMRVCVGADHDLARIGGDEFTILIKYILSGEEALNVARRVIDVLQEPVTLLEHDVRITASIGISLYPQHGHTSSELMKQADMAMYQAKLEGRNRVSLYSRSYDEKRCERFQMLTQLPNR